MKKLFTWMVLAGAAIALAACNSGSSTPSTPSACPTPSGNTTVLVYPAPNATSVPDSFGQIIVGSTTALSTSYDLLVTTALSPGGVLGGNFTTATPPFPTPNATPSFPNPVYQSSSFAGGVFPGEVVTVYINDPGSNCNPIGPVGSFTTQ